VYKGVSTRAAPHLLRVHRCRGKQLVQRQLLRTASLRLRNPAPRPRVWWRRVNGAQAA